MRTGKPMGHGLHIEWRWSLTLDLDKDENYFNQKLALGYKPITISLAGRIVFESCQPGKYICFASMTRKRHVDSKDDAKQCESGLAMIEGTTIVGPGNPFGNYQSVYVLRPTTIGIPERYSSLDSHIAEYDRRKKYCQNSLLLLSLLSCLMLAGGIASHVTMQSLSGALWVVFQYAASTFGLATAVLYCRAYLQNKSIIARLKAQQ
jgi:hypothetical protein